ncbi:hypothetical protein BC628DRAFT_580406 [Trametes gibbosa]|nr:hypothetical protein BC628DRAFT_580406 [Trametes gibbosa]
MRPVTRACGQIVRGRTATSLVACGTHTASYKVSLPLLRVRTNMMHIPLSQKHSSPKRPPSLASTANANAATSPSPSAPTSPPKGVKRIVSGLKRRISHTFLRGHRHHTSIDTHVLSHPSPLIVQDVDNDDHRSLLISPAPADAHPIPISVSVSQHPPPSVDTLTRSIAAGGLGKHSADCSDSSDATSNYSSGSSFGARGHRAESSDSGSFSYTSPRGLEAGPGDEPSTAPLPEIAESISSADPDPSALSPHSDPTAANQAGLVHELALFVPLPDDTESDFGVGQDDSFLLWGSEASISDIFREDRRSVESLYSRLPAIESLTAPVDQSVFEDDSSLEIPRERSLSDSLASIEFLTAPLESLVLFEDEVHFQISHDIQSDTVSTHLLLPAAGRVDLFGELTPQLYLSTPLPPSPSDSPSILPMEPQQLREPRTSTLDPQLTAPMGLPRAEPLFSPSANAGEPDVSVSDPSLRESEDTSEVPTFMLPEDTLSPSPTSAVEEVNLASAEPSTPSAPHSSNLNKSVPPTPPAARDEEEEALELYLSGLTLPTMFLPISNARYPVFSSLTWWLSKSLINYSSCTIRQAR